MGGTRALLGEEGQRGHRRADEREGHKFEASKPPPDPESGSALMVYLMFMDRPHLRTERPMFSGYLDSIGG